MPTGCPTDLAIGTFNGYKLPDLFTNFTGITNALCISSATARASVISAAIFPYVGLEYGRECYTRTVALSPQPSRFIGSKACPYLGKGNAAEIRDSWATIHTTLSQVLGVLVWQ